MAMRAGHGPRSGRLGWRAWGVLALAWFATIGVRPLLDPDEGRYAEIPREMRASGDWVTPRFNDLKYFEKPPLQYWATAFTYGVVGVHEWSSRLWSVGLAFACLPLTFAWVARLYGSERALLALTALAVSPFFVVVGHINLLDGAFCFWLIAAVLGFTLAQQSPAGSGPERRWMLAAWAAAALAVLSKGIVVAVLAGAALLLYALIERDARIFRRLHLIPGVTLFAAIAAPWFIVVSLRNPSFPGFFFVHEHFTRFLTTVHQRVEPWWYFLPLLAVGVLPWGAALVRACGIAWSDPPGDAALREAGEGVAGAPGSGGARFRARRFLLIFAGVTLVFFSASGSKLAPYILPLLPVLAAVTGAASGGGDEFPRRAARVGAALVVIIAAGLLVYCARRNSYVPLAALVWSGAAVLAAFVALLMTRAGGPPRRALAVAAGAILAWQCLLCAYAVIPPARSARALVEQVRSAIGADTALYSVGQYRETISPYLGRTLLLAGYEGELGFGLHEEPWRRLDLAGFAARWSAGGAAVAFFDPGVWDSLRRRGLPGRVLAADNYTVAVSRL
jgi:4-amino-4-deoxy-L-arabinose transferase-like glycosyltransferase